MIGVGNNAALQTWLFYLGAGGLVLSLVWYAARLITSYFGAHSENGSGRLDMRVSTYAGHDISGTVYTGETVNVHHHHAPQPHPMGTALGLLPPQPPTKETESIYEKLARRNRAQRDTKLKDAINYAVTGLWDSPPLENTQGGLIQRAGEELVKFHQFALDGELRVWGQHPVSKIYVEIPPHYWTANRIRFLSIFLDQTAMEVDDACELPRPPYTDHMVSKVQVERLWPPTDANEMLSLQQASQVAYEVAERDGWLDLVVNRKAVEHAQLAQFKYMMVLVGADGLAVLTGIRPPSTQRYPIPAYELRNVHPEYAATSNLHESHPGGALMYRDVSISRRDLDKVIEKYRGHAENARQQ
ncbi:MAG TPA: hypothetical protein VHT03_01605 [Rhizomicrobium sp.]|nr:hypothetical protein [Rhizomicrobium sp.]